MTTKPVAVLSWSLNVHCPKCRGRIDMANEDCEHSVAKHIFSNDWSKLDDWEVTCPHCQHEFKIERVEY